MTFALPDHFFRHEYGRLVAVLARRFGVAHLEAIEDAVQGSLLVAVETWTRSERPDDPSAWLFRVAERRLVEDLRRTSRRKRLLAEHGPVAAPTEFAEPEVLLAGDVRDDLLRMLFVCCDPRIPTESQGVLALKILCGFDVREIAERLFTGEAGVYKRLARARAVLGEGPRSTAEFTEAELASRLPVVRSVLYVTFTEGYLSSRADAPLRRELCDEATRLAILLAEHPATGGPETSALVALMHLHGARFSSRMDAAGGLLLLEEQDRSTWDTDAIRTGLEWLARSAEGDTFSRFHAEAGIAAEHALAPSMAETRWDRIAEGYACLETAAPSPLHTLNRAVAVAEAQGPRAGLAIVEAMDPPQWLATSWMWSAVLADLLGRAGETERARPHHETALRTAPSDAVRAALSRRLGFDRR
ncbi:MAG: DUF6596 domain-containing protein [Polyangiaceae bacterium]